MIVPEHLEKGISELVRCLQALTDSQLDELAEGQRGRTDPTTASLVSGQLVWENPVDGVDNAVNDLRIAEQQGRYEVLARTEADLAGGHLVHVGHGNNVAKYSAICDPNPPGKFLLDRAGP